MEIVLRRLPGFVKNEQDAVKARKQETAKLEKESLDRTGCRSDVVSLYNGGQYWLYRYKKYTDIRLVFAPEQQAAFVGPRAYAPVADRLES